MRFLGLIMLGMTVGTMNAMADTVYTINDSSFMGFGGTVTLDSIGRVDGAEVSLTGYDNFTVVQNNTGTQFCDTLGCSANGVTLGDDQGDTLSFLYETADSSPIYQEPGISLLIPEGYLVLSGGYSVDNPAGTLDPAPVPLPSTLPLLGLGLLNFGMLRKRSG